MFIIPSGVLQPIERPEACIRNASDSLRTIDNTGDPFNFGGKAAGSRSFSISGWFKFAAFQLGVAPDRYTELYFGHGNAYSYFLRLYESGSATFGGFFIGAFCPNNNNVMAINKWFHVTVTQDDTNDRQYIYIFDEQQYLASGTTTLTNNPASDATDFFYIGTARGVNVNSYNGFFNGVGVWSRALTNTEVHQLWNRGYGLKYQHLTTGLKSSMVSWWDLDSISSDVVSDKHTNGYNVTATVGGASTKASLR